MGLETSGESRYRLSSFALSTLTLAVRRLDFLEGKINKIGGESFYLFSAISSILYHLLQAVGQSLLLYFWLQKSLTTFLSSLFVLYLAK